MKRALRQMGDGRGGGGKVDAATYAALVRWCGEEKALSDGRRVHAHMAASRGSRCSSRYLGNLLLLMYGKCGSPRDAWRVFTRLHRPNICSWNLMISACARNGDCARALRLFARMEEAGFAPNEFTFLPIIAAAASAGLHSLRQAHRLVASRSLDSEPLVRNTLLSAYGRRGALGHARLLFNTAPRRDLVMWNAMISASTANGHARDALELFRRMRSEDIVPNWITYLSALDACASLGSVNNGKEIHQQVVSSGFSSNVAVKTALVNMYGKCGSVKDARAVFDEIHLPDVISWTSMITVYAHNGCSKEALELFKQMDASGINADMVTFISVLDACANMASLKDGKMVHERILARGFLSNPVVRCALVYMYGKCGSLTDARKIFDQLRDRNMILWTAMIAAYAQNGYGKEALDLFQHMNLEGIKPNWITFISALDACASLPSLEEGKVVHHQIICSGTGFNIALWNALLTMYSKCGSLNNARIVFNEMHERNVISWTSMMAAYAQHGHGKEALELFKEMEAEDAKPNEVTFISILNACSHMGLLNACQEYFVAMTANHAMTPRREHFICMSNLLGHVGQLAEAQDLIANMPAQPTAIAWTTLLGACRTHGDIQCGMHAAEHIFELNPEDASNYVLLSKIYASAGRWTDASKIEKLWKSGVQVSEVPLC